MPACLDQKQPCGAENRTILLQENAICIRSICTTKTPSLKIKSQNHSLSIIRHQIVYSFILCLVLFHEGHCLFDRISYKHGPCEYHLWSIPLHLELLGLDEGWLVV